MKVLRALGAALVVTCAAMACSDVPLTPTSASSSTTATPTGASASPFSVKYTVTAAAGANGKISPSGTVSVEAAGIQGFTLTPDPNYHVTDVVVDGSSVGAVMSYTFTNVLANHTIAATFAINDTLDGLYVGTLVLSAVSGGECVGADLQSQFVGGINASTVSITTQQQYDVTAIVRSLSTGLFCTYKGNSRTGLFAANDVNDRTCNATILFQCSNGNSRILVPVGSTITAAVSGNSASGVVATTFNVYREDDAGTRHPVAGLTTQETFNATRR